MDALQANLGRFFRDASLLKQALTHPSAAAEEGLPRIRSYERLEFLGDALLGFALAELLFDRYPQEEEGVLSRLRAYWASQPVLAEVARGLGLQACIGLGVGESKDGGAEKDRILASALEALLGALYLDAGLKPATALVRKLWGPAIRRQGLAVLLEDAKTTLQERRQAVGLPLPVYQSEPAPDGAGFTCTVLLDGEVSGRGSGPTRKAAEQAAAREALSALDRG
jgi:ribonuclease-3